MTPDRHGVGVGRVVVIGEALRADDFALAGATVLRADDGDAVRSAWDGLPADAVVVVLTPRADALSVGVAKPDGVLTVVMPP